MKTYSASHKILFLLALIMRPVGLYAEIEHANWSTNISLPSNIEQAVRAKYPKAEIINGCKGSYSEKGLQELAVLVHDPAAGENGTLFVQIFLGEDLKRQEQIRITNGFAIFSGVENGVGVMSLTSQEVRERNDVGYADAGGIKSISANDTLCVADAADGSCFQLNGKTNKFMEVGGWAN